MLTKLVHESNVANVSFGIENEADFKAEQIQYGREFTVLEISNKFSKNVSAHLLGATEEYKIQLPGQINAYNALAVIATLRALGFAQEQIALELISYLGVKRRFEVVGRKNGITIVDDYAHHPTAVRETLKAARLRYFSAKDEGSPPKSDIKDKGLKIKDSRRLWAIFEPHTFSRTKATLEELTTSFDAADQVLISEIYPAREKASSATITSEQVIAAIKDKGSGMKDKIRLVKTKTEALDILKAELKPGDVVIIMAVGSFNRLAYELKEVL
jgi:UDP-N-acetylmuramate--alanine ligase